MANTTGCKRKHKDSQKNMHERTKAIKDMMAISKAVYMLSDSLSDSYLYQTPSAIWRNMSTEDINKKNKQWLKKVKPKSHMTKKEYRRWKNKMKRLGVA